MTVYGDETPDPEAVFQTRSTRWRTGGKLIRIEETEHAELETLFNQLRKIIKPSSWSQIASRDRRGGETPIVIQAPANTPRSTFVTCHFTDTWLPLAATKRTRKIAITGVRTTRSIWCER